MELRIVSVLTVHNLQSKSLRIDLSKNKEMFLGLSVVCVFVCVVPVRW